MDFVSQLPASPNQSAVRGLNLLFLLVENRLAEFHSELELMRDEERASECVMFPVRLEQLLMVGSYDQVRWEARREIGRGTCFFFLFLFCVYKATFTVGHTLGRASFCPSAAPTPMRASPTLVLGAHGETCGSVRAQLQRNMVRDETPGAPSSAPRFKV